MNGTRVVIAPDRDQLTALVADKFVVRARKTLERTGAFRVVLTGGRLGTDVLRAIAAHPTTHTLDWSKVSVFWGDERFVPEGDEDRNDEQAQAALLAALPQTPGRIVRFPAASAEIRLDEAETTARNDVLGAGEQGQWPDFDLALLGMGPDGHVLSVFPGTDLARAQSPDVAAVWHSPKPPAERLTMTIPLVNRSQRVWVVVSGAEKAAALGLALAGAATAEVPAAGVRGIVSTKIFADQELASMLPDELVRDERFWSAEDERADYVPKALR